MQVIYHLSRIPDNVLIGYLLIIVVVIPIMIELTKAAAEGIYNLFTKKPQPVSFNMTISNSDIWEDCTTDELYERLYKISHNMQNYQARQSANDLYRAGIGISNELKKRFREVSRHGQQ